MNTTEQINDLVLEYGLSETVRQIIINIVKDASDDDYQLGYSVALDKLSE